MSSLCIFINPFKLGVWGFKLVSFYLSSVLIIVLHCLSVCLSSFWNFTVMLFFVSSAPFLCIKSDTFSL